MKGLLQRLARHGEISWLSYHFAEFIASRSGTDLDALPCLTAAMLSDSNQRGSVCIDLAALEQKPLFISATIDADEQLYAPSLSTWKSELNGNACFGTPGEAAPMTLDGNRLYLNRFWHYEQFIAGRLNQLVEQTTKSDHADLDRLFDDLFVAEDELDADQKQAVLSVARRRFSVISGGPGSGKTSTVVRILALLLALDPATRIALAAPTGKAAARMLESIRQRVDQLDVSAPVSAALPRQAHTLHRLLGFRQHEFGFDENNPLPVDCVVIDEASMIDTRLMFHLLAALPPNARLILLGDRDQLASVAAGNVLGDITGHGYVLDRSQLPPISESISLLRSNYRFDSDSAIGELATLVNQGQAAEALETMSRRHRGLDWIASDRLDEDMLGKICADYESIFDTADPASALDVYAASRVLCATNHGPLGVDRLNFEISNRLRESYRLPAADYFQGLPIMVTRNQHALGLYNGDTGILWHTESGLRVFLRDDDGSLRDIGLNRITDFAPAWAYTVHKSQGSEFDQVILILPPDADSETLSRELLYTAITRARQRFILLGRETVFERAIARLTRRHSGLAARLGWQDLALSTGPA